MKIISECVEACTRFSHAFFKRPQFKSRRPFDHTSRIRKKNLKSTIDISGIYIA
jgi:hypothetical protein